jgi:outer membrane protein OmpA-like peptidoglycan-associated protein
MRPSIVACVVLVGLASAARAAPMADCPPVGSLPNYLAAVPPAMRAYDAVEFTARVDGEEKPVVVAGQACRQAYTLKEGVDALSDLEIQANVRDQLTRAGGEILFTSARYTTARIAKGGQETWVQVYSGETSFEVVVLRKQPRQQVLLKPSGNDYKLVGHMPDFIAGTPAKRNFDQATLTVQDADGERELDVQGAKYSVDYQIKEGVAAPTNLDIQENYRTALIAQGAQILYTGSGYTAAHMENAGVSTWIQINSSETSVQVVVIEEKPLVLSIKPPTEEALKKAIDADGHAAFYVAFDFDRATLRPEAAPVIALMVKLLKDSPDLKVLIEGHTDNIGAADYNLRLSDARARAVMEAVVAGGVARERLSASGIGAARPLADNAAAEGRAKNRRVELVRR